MIKEQLKRFDYIQSNSGKLFAYIDKILPKKVRVWLINKDNERAYILDEELKDWSYGNPIKDNRIVDSITFAVRFKQFLDWIPKKWVLSQPHYEEEYEYMKIIADNLLKYQIQTATDKKEINYLKRLELC